MDKKQVKSSMGTGSRLLGAMVYWTELKGVRVSRPLFRTGIRQAGLGAALSEEPKPEALLNRAVGVANQSTIGDVDTKTKAGYAKLKSKDTHAVYAVLMRRDVGDRMTYREEATVTIERGVDAPHPVVETRHDAKHDDTRDALIATITDTYSELLGYANTQEVSETLVRAVRDTCSGLTLRSGLYLVRPEYLDALRALEAFLATSCGAQLEVWEQRDTTANATTAKRNARTSLREQFDELLADVTKFADEHPVPEDVAMKSINAKVKRFKELDAKVQLYADIIGDYRDELLKAIADTKRKLLGAYLDTVDEAA